MAKAKVGGKTFKSKAAGMRYEAFKHIHKLCKGTKGGRSKGK
jgi:hypothetical protein